MKRAFAWAGGVILFGGLIVGVFYLAGATTVLEYLKVLLTWPVAAIVIVVFLARTFRLPLSQWLSHLKIDYGGASFSSSQQHKPTESQEEEKPAVAQSAPQTEVQQLQDDSADKLKELVLQWRANAYLWEYRYLNHFLVLNTQKVLDWLYDLNKPIDVEVADSVWRTIIPSQEERVAIVEALRQHYLAMIEGKNLVITPKGREYVEQRGRVLPLPQTPVATK